jgi:uncharacterized DUF497 family protein
MTARRFEWDETKNRSNQRKHGVSFEEAARIFLDPLHVSILERVEGGEQRWQSFGVVGNCLLLMVAHSTTEEDDADQPVEVIRIISARRANRKERRRYENETG